MGGLYMACFYGDYKAARRILCQPNALDLVNDQQKLGGYTPLMCAIIKNKITIVRLLLSVSGINLDLKSNTGFTALGFAKRRPAHHGAKLIKNKQKILY